MRQTGYTDAFWLRAIELTMRNPKECEECSRPNGWIERDQFDRPKKRNAKPLLVRVALRIGKGIYPSNLGLFCTKCRRGNYEVRKLKREELDEMILPLFQ